MTIKAKSGDEDTIRQALVHSEIWGMPGRGTGCHLPSALEDALLENEILPYIYGDPIADFWILKIDPSVQVEALHQ